MDALTANPAVWSRTVFLVMYDENDGYFDHVVPPTPPLSRDQGLSTVAVDTERHTLTGQPYGLGMRVPMLAISPWSKGGWVCSETFDHTSVLRFMEKRFGVRARNISPWRRTISGDLTSAFDFTKPSMANPRTPGSIAAETPLPDQATFNAFKAVVGKRPRPAVPHDTPLPQVESGTRPSRALGYRLQVSGHAVGDTVQLEFANDGKIGGHFHVVDRLRAEPAPRRYTVGAGRMLSDHWPMVDGRYALTVHGPAGQVWWFEGVKEEPLMLTSEALPTGDLLLLIAAPGGVATQIDLHESYADRNWRRTIRPGVVTRELLALTASHHWYDVTLRHGSWMRRLAGRVETGRPGLSDPALCRCAGT
jgi:phospholipase C